MIGYAINAIILLIGLFELWTRLLTPGQKELVKNLLTNFYSGAVSVAEPLLAAVQDELGPMVTAYIAGIEAIGGPIFDDLAIGFEKLAAKILEAQRGAIATIGLSTTTNAIDAAATAFTTAFGAGLASSGVASAFEAAFPEKLNTLDGVAPMIGKLAGFDQVAGEVLGPLYSNAFGKSLEYKYRAQFKPEYPSERDAVEWHSRRLDIGWKLEDVFAVSGLKSEYEAAYIEAAYRPISVRALANAFIDVPVPVAQLRDTMEFTGNRPVDIAFMIHAIQLNSVKSLRNAYLSAVTMSAERGTLTAAEVVDAVQNSASITDAAQLVQLTIAVRKLEQLAELYRKSITEAYKTGQITDAEYLPQLEAIGIAQADAEAHYAVDSIAVRGKALSAEQRAAARAAATLQRAQVQAALAEFRSS